MLGWAGGRQRVPGEEAASRRDTRQAAGGWVQAPGLGAEDARTHTHTGTHAQTLARAHSHRRTPGPAPAAPGHQGERSREMQNGAGVPRIQMM